MTVTYFYKRQEIGAIHEVSTTLKAVFRYCCRELN